MSGPPSRRTGDGSYNPLVPRTSDPSTADPRFAAIAEQPIVGIAETDATGRFVFVNDRFCAITGRDRAELLTQRMPDITHPDDVVDSVQFFERCVTAGESFTTEKRYVRRDGSAVWVQVHVTPVRDASGTALGAIAVVDDISVRKAWQQKLVEADERYRLLGRATNDVIWDWDRRTNHVAWSESLATVFGYPPLDADGPIEPAVAWWSGHIHPDERDDVLATFLAAAHGNAEVWAKEYRFLAADGTYRYVFDRGYIARNSDGEAVRMVGSMQDVSTLRRSEAERERLYSLEKAARAEAEEANRLKDEFLATLSHELRTPLNSILGWTQLVREARLPPERVARALLSIEQNAQAQKGLVESLLDLSSIVTGKLALHVAVTDLSAVVRAAIDVVRPTADAKQIVLDHLLPETAPHALADAARLQQVVWNLLSNAVKFTPAGGRVSVTLHADANDATIVVTDTGDGITDDFLPHVFERFRQADSSTSRTYGGLGLGLSIVKELVERHAGSVTAHSEGRGRGSTFTVSLPLEPREPPPQG